MKQFAFLYGRLWLRRHQPMPEQRLEVTPAPTATCWGQPTPLGREVPADPEASGGDRLGSAATSGCSHVPALTLATCSHLGGTESHGNLNLFFS